MVLLLALGCLFGRVTPVAEERVYGECPLDTCVDGTVDEASGTDCCIAAYGRGLDADAEETLAAACVGDACDPSLYLSEDAAVCVAQVNGLPTGIGDCSGWFQADATHAWWIVENEEERCASGAYMCGGGSIREIDALTGECTGEGSWAN